jgi:hypothetical protein
MALLYGEFAPSSAEESAFSVGCAFCRDFGEELAAR